jgi:acetyl esterase/lipase
LVVTSPFLGRFFIITIAGPSLFYIFSKAKTKSICMKKALSIIFAALLGVLLLLLAITTLTVFAKAPMMLSGYSSLFTAHFNSRLIVLGLALMVICLTGWRYADHGRGLFKVDLALAVIFILGQGAFMIVMFGTASKYDARVDLATSFSSYAIPIQPKDSLVYSVIDGEPQLMDIYGDVSRRKSQSIPVILVHGGGFIEGNRRQAGYAPEWFASRGCTVFSIDYPLGRVGRHTWEMAANAVATAMGFVSLHADSLKVDAQKMVLVGGSAGAALVMQADLGLREGWVQPYDSLSTSLPAAVIAVYPPVSLSELWDKMVAGKTVDLRDAATRYLGGSPAQYPDRYKRLNLIDHLSRGISPTLIVAGSIDHVVNVEATRSFVRQSARKGLAVQYVEVPYGEHVFDANPNALAGQIEWSKIEDFLVDNHLVDRN